MHNPRFKTPKPVSTYVPTVPAGMIALSDWARANGLTREQVNELITAGQITPTTVELQGYPVRHIHADTRLPREKAPRPEPECLPYGMVYLTDWARQNGVSSKTYSKMINRGAIPTRRSDRGRLIVRADTPRPARRSARNAQ